jgi:dTDP-4-dehydrorhamnose reductase
VILLFGAQGQLGRELVAAAHQAKLEVHGPREEEIDIADPQAVGDAIARLRPDIVVNAAAYTDVDRAESETDLAWRVNAIGPEVIADSVGRAGIPLIHLSTDYVFDGTKSGPYAEDDPVAPIGAYGRSKAAGEVAVRQAAPRHLILRTAWLYGRHGGNFVKTVIRLAAEREEIGIVADQFGSPTSAADLAQAIVRVAPRLLQAEAPYGTFHLAGDGATSWFGFAEKIVAEQAGITGRRPKVTPIATSEYPTAARRPLNSVLDCARFAETFGISLPSWQDSIGQVVASILAEAVA